jgi:hypothetical protein
MTTLNYDIRWSPEDPAAAGWQARLRLAYEDRETGHRQYRAVSLDATHPAYRWTLEVPNGATGAAFFSGVLFCAAKGAVPLPLQPLVPSTMLNPGALAALPTVPTLPEDGEDVELGVRVFAASVSDFKTVSTIAVCYLFAGEPRSFRLTREQPFWVLFAGLDYPPDEPLVYDLRYSVAEGSYLQAGLATSATLNPLPYPFVPCPAAFVPVGLTGTAPTVRAIQLQYENLEDGAGWKIASPQSQATLDAAHPTLEWGFLAVDPALARVRYSGKVVMLSGIQVPIPLTETTIKQIPVGDTPGVPSVEVTAAMIHWDLYATVLASVWTAGAQGQKENLGKHVFEKGTPPWYWRYVGPRTDYLWQAVYYPRAGGSIETPEWTCYAPVLTLPSEV